MRSTRPRLTLGALALTALALAPGLPAGARGASTSAVQHVSQAGVAGTTLTPVRPCRLFDGRRTPDSGRVDAGTWRLAVTGRCGVPATAQAVAISLVATDTSAAGFVSVYPEGSTRPDVSNLNYDRGNTVANSAVVKLSATGSIDVHTSAAANIIVDVTGVFIDAPGGARAGRFVTVDPRRVVDTRTSGRRGDGEIRVPIPAGIPSDAIALAVGITAVGAASSGYLSVYPAGTTRGETSVVNTDEHDRTRANVVFVPVSADGFIVFRSMETDVLVDLWGWFTGPSAPSSADGLFVARAPRRAWDSRVSFDPIHQGGTVEKQLLAASAAAIVANVTVVEPTGWGFLSVFAAGTSLPNVSSLNYRWRHPVAALTVSRVSDRGLALHSHAGAHVIVDVAGWFTGAATVATARPPVNAPPAGTTEVLFVSDSSFAGIRWNGTLPLLQGAVFDSRLESCRRLIGSSCRGREGYAPMTAENELATAVPGRYGVAIIAAGYNDSASTFGLALDAVIAAARLRGIDRVMWMTYRENVGYTSPAGVSNSASFASMNQSLRSAQASGRYPELLIADWQSYSFAQGSWLTADGVHFTVAGARAASEYVSRKLAAIERRPCPAAVGGASSPGGWCADPDSTGPP